MAEKVGAIYYEVELDTAKLVQGQRQVSQQVDLAAQKFSTIVVAVKALAAAYAALKIMETADHFRLLQARIEVAAGSTQLATAAFGDLVAMSRRTYTSVEANIELFTRLNQSIVQMGGSQADTLQLTELLSKAIKVSGASATETRSALLQFGQALGSGKLAGDELRSLLENAPYLMRQLADGIGVPVGALKTLGEQGKLTADVVVNALSKAAAKIDEDFKKFPLTFDAAMQVLRDDAALALTQFEGLTGKSVLLTGAVVGVSQVVEQFGKILADMNAEAGAFDRNKAIQDWAGDVKVALSYVADAADIVWQTLSVLGRNVAFVFQGIGTEVGGIAAQVAAVVRGDFAGARAIGEEMTAEAERRRKELEEADAKTLARTKTWGQQMREAWEQGTSRRGRLQDDPVSRLAPPGGAVGGASKPQFDAAGYLATLQQASLDGIAKIDAAEQEALRRNAKLLSEKKITAAEAEQAITLIHDKAAKDRLDIQLKNAGDIYQAMVDGYKAENDLAKKQSEERKKGQQFATELSVEGDPIAKLQQELEAKSALLAQYAAIDQDNLLLYAQAKLALEKDTAAKILEIRKKQVTDQQAAESQQLQNYGNMFSSLAGIVQAFSSKQNGLYRSLFAASKAFALADAIIKIQQGIANAAALPFPANLGAIGSVIAATAGVVSTIQSTSYGGGRQYGGPTSAGSLYRVNESGRPEMFTAANGNQYMLGSASGQVTPADGVGGGGNTFHQEFNIGSGMSRSEVYATMQTYGQQLKGEILESINNNGAFARRSA